jgi:hypothetical protein
MEGSIVGWLGSSQVRYCMLQGPSKFAGTLCEVRSSSINTLGKAQSGEGKQLKGAQSRIDVYYGHNSQLEKKNKHSLTLTPATPPALPPAGLTS